MKTITKQIITWSSAFIFLIFITQRIFFFRHGFLENASSVITYPVIASSSAIAAPIKNIFKRKNRLEQLYTRVEHVQEKYRELVDENIKLKATLNRYESIQDLVDFQKRYKTKTGVISKIIIAYEPIWAIGSTAKREATPEESLEMSLYIKKSINDIFGKRAIQGIKILYGGSVHANNAIGFLRDGGVDGLLVGRASLDAKQLSEIIIDANKM